MFQKILLPTDGSRHAEEAARIAGEMAARHDGVVHPIVAVEYQYVTSHDLPEEMASALRSRVEARARLALETANDYIRRAGGKTDGGTVVEGRPAEAILQVAEDGEYDLIVVGSRGVNLEDDHHRIIGSVTERVLHRALCPVLVIRAPAAP